MPAGLAGCVEVVAVPDVATDGGQPEGAAQQVVGLVLVVGECGHGELVELGREDRLGGLVSHGVLR